jgi:hypothetical protein
MASLAYTPSSRRLPYSVVVQTLTVTELLGVLNGRAVEGGCLDCTGVEVPNCPECPSGQSCVQNVQTCTACVTRTCVAIPAGPSTASTSAPPPKQGGGINAGAVAGGVIGGVVLLAALIYLSWRFFVKNKRPLYESEDWVEFQHDRDGSEKQASTRDPRASTFTVGSFASSVMTRASNIIQIGYVPGMNKQTGNYGGLVPPVPPIPAAHSSSTDAETYGDEHFFMPGDLRDSTYSGKTDRTSYANRSSVASTVYGKNTVISPVLPQTVLRAKAAVVSVRSGGASATSSEPPVPSVNLDRYRSDSEPQSPAFSVGSTFLGLGGATPGSGIRHAPSTIAEMSGEDTPARPQKTQVVTDQKTVNAGRSPFADPDSGSTTASNSPVELPAGRYSMLSRTIAAAASAKAQPEHGRGADDERSTTPFGDENEARE